MPDIWASKSLVPTAHTSPFMTMKASGFPAPDLVPEVVDSARCPQRCVLLNEKNDEAKKLKKRSTGYLFTVSVKGVRSENRKKGYNALAHPFLIRANL
jgi:hypothetical protein